MAHCEEYTELISAALDGALSPAQQEKLEAHLSSCPECAALFRQLSALHAALEDLPPAEPPADLKDRILDTVAREQVLPFTPPKKKGLSYHSQRWLTTAAALALVIFGAWSWKPWERNDVTKPTSAAGASGQVSVSAEVEESAMPEMALRGIAPQEELIAPQAVEPSPTPQAVEETAQDSPANVSSASAPMSGRAGDADGGIASEETAPQARTAKTLPEEDREPSPSSDVPGVTAFRSPALFSAPIPSDLPEENSEETPGLLMVGSGVPEELAEIPELTSQEALERLLKEYPKPGCETWEYTDIEPGWQSPEWTAEDGSTAWLSYVGPGEGENGLTVYLFDVWRLSPDGQQTCAATHEVPADGGEITTAGA